MAVITIFEYLIYCNLLPDIPHKKHDWFQLTKRSLRRHPFSATADDKVVDPNVNPNNVIFV